jgi:hypothetical protein
LDETVDIIDLNLFGVDFDDDSLLLSISFVVTKIDVFCIFSLMGIVGVAVIDWPNTKN